MIVKAYSFHELVWNPGPSSFPEDLMQYFKSGWEVVTSWTDSRGCHRMLIRIENEDPDETLTYRQISDTTFQDLKKKSDYLEEFQTYVKAYLELPSKENMAALFALYMKSKLET